jgi:RNA polymerase sigma-70 factor (ECF subfamily)
VEELLRQHGRLVYRIAYSVLGNAADAEEVSQEVFLRAFRKLGGLRDPEKFRAWVARMSWRLAINHRRGWLRDARRDTAWQESTAAPEPQPEGILALREQITRLPDKLRAVLLLSAIEGLESPDIAAILEIPEGTVRSRLHLARRQLWEALS